jgi:hypothetical protein
MVIGKPIAKILSWGAARVIMPKEKLINNIAVIGARANERAVANIQLPHSTTSRNLILEKFSVGIGKVSKLATTNCK